MKYESKEKIKEFEKRIEVLETNSEKLSQENESSKRWRIIGTLIPIIISIIALYQTSRNRDIDYKPELRIDTGAFGMTWDEKGAPLSEDEEVYQEVNKYIYNTQVDRTPSVGIQNIASKPAKDIKIVWNDEENVEVISKALQRENSDTIVYLEDELFVIQRKNEKKRYIQANTIQEINFLCNDPSRGKDFLFIPNTYYELIKDIVKTDIDYHWNLTLKLSCTCKDLQGKNHLYEVELVFSPNYCYGYNNEVVDGKNGCVLEIKANIVEKDDAILLR